MIRPDMIPDEVVEAGVKAFAEAEDNDYTSRAEDLAAAFLAMLQAWEGSYSLAENDSAIIRDVAVIILPLPQEASDE